MKKPREQDTVTAILQFLKLHRIHAWRMSVGATKIDRRFVRFGVPGMSDIIACLPPLGRWAAIEVKAPKGRVSPAQQAFLDTVNAAGGKAFVARDVATVARELGL